jgi:hypothetical protein
MLILQMKIWYKYVAISNKNSLETDDQLNYDFFYTLKDDAVYFTRTCCLK